MDYKDILIRLKCPDDIEKCTRLKKYQNSCVLCRDETMKDAADAIDSLLAKRDAKTNGLRDLGCLSCKYFDSDIPTGPCVNCYGTNWKWRGPQKQD